MKGTVGGGEWRRTAATRDGYKSKESEKGEDGRMHGFVRGEEERGRPASSRVERRRGSLEESECEEDSSGFCTS